MPSIVKPSSYVLGALLCSVTAFSAANLTAHADIVLESLKESVPVRLQAPLSTTETPLEAPVAVTLPDAIHWKEAVIPAGTVLQASVIQNKEARRLGRPAHFKLAITEATLPQHEPIKFSKPLELTLGINPYETRRSLATRQIFISTASNLATLPLDFVPGVSTLAAYGIGSGLDVLIGAGQELQKDETFDKRSTGRRVAVGAFRGATAIPTYASMLKKGNNLSYQADELVMAAMEEPLWEALLQPEKTP